MASKFDRIETGIDCSKDEVLVKQSFKDESDINLIVARALQSGFVANVNSRAPFYGDVSDVVSYRESLEIVERSQEMFAALPADLRARFRNDPSELLLFLENPGNLDEAVKLGIVVKPAKPGKPSGVSPEAPASGGSGQAVSVS